MTWNINSLRLRLPLLQQVVADAMPDIICIQETKVEDGSFPLTSVQDLGYPYVYFRGMKGYNGVCILSKTQAKNVGSHDFCHKNDARHIYIELESGVEIHNFYVPAGGDEPDPEINDKFAHKLQFLQEMHDYFIDFKNFEQPIIVVGDLNIAPLEQDVWSHKQLVKVVSHTPIEIQALNKVQNSIGFMDLMRYFIPPEQKLYSWWSYRGLEWDKADRGRRLDHIWSTQSLAQKAHEMAVMKSYRGADRPSDHVPVWIDFKETF